MGREPGAASAEPLREWLRSIAHPPSEARSTSRVEHVSFFIAGPQSDPPRPPGSAAFMPRSRRTPPRSTHATPPLRRAPRSQRRGRGTVPLHVAQQLDEARRQLHAEPRPPARRWRGRSCCTNNSAKPATNSARWTVQSRGIPRSAGPGVLPARGPGRGAPAPTDWTSYAARPMTSGCTPDARPAHRRCTRHAPGPGRRLRQHPPGADRQPRHHEPLPRGLPAGARPAPRHAARRRCHPRRRGRRCLRSQPP